MGGLAGVVAIAAGGLLWMALAARPDPGEPPQARAAAQADRPPDDPARPAARGADTGAPHAAYEGPGAPSPAPTSLLAEEPDLTAVRDDARDEVIESMREWVRELDERFQEGDWDAIREAGAAVEAMPEAYAEAAIAALERSGDPREALIAGLLFEELIAERDGLAAAERARLGEVLTPLLAHGVRGGALSEAEGHHAIRVASRFPGDDVEAELLAILADPGADLTTRRYALFGLAEVGSPAAAPALRRLAATGGAADGPERALGWAAQAETARIAALAIHQIALRAGDGALLTEVEQQLHPHLEAMLAPALEADEGDLFANLTGTLAVFTGLDMSAYLATRLLDHPGVPDAVKVHALDELAARRAVEQLDALESRQGRLGSSAANDRLERTIELLRALRED